MYKQPIIHKYLWYISKCFNMLAYFATSPSQDGYCQNTLSPFVVLAWTKHVNTREVLSGISSLEGEEKSLTET